MTAPITDETPLCVLQERCYSDGWRDYAKSQITGGRPGPLQPYYAIGWRDHQTRDKCAAMYAGRDTNERTQR